MKIITSDIEYNAAKSRDLITLECYQCKGMFEKLKCEVNRVKVKLNTTQWKGQTLNCCSRKCANEYNKRGKLYSCTYCGKTVYRQLSDSKKTKHIFCTQSCAAVYNNTHKTTGNRRSKLEIWLEQKLPKLYPNLEFHFNRKDTINSELDIYIPSLKLAFELNGIFHYEPIYSEKKLQQIQTNDDRKFQACIEKNIELCIIDTSTLNYFKESNVIPFLDIIVKIINEKIGRGGT